MMIFAKCVNPRCTAVVWRMFYAKTCEFCRKLKV